MDEIIHKPKLLRKLISKKRNEKPYESTAKISTLVRQGIKLGFQLAGENATDMDEKNMKLVSPRFLSLVPEDNETDSVGFFCISLYIDKKILNEINTFKFYFIIKLITLGESFIALTL